MVSGPHKGGDRTASAVVGQVHDDLGASGCPRMRRAATETRMRGLNWTRMMKRRRQRLDWIWPSFDLNIDKTFFRYIHFNGILEKKGKLSARNFIDFPSLNPQRPLTANSAKHAITQVSIELGSDRCVYWEIQRDDWKNCGWLQGLSWSIRQYPRSRHQLLIL